MSLEIQLTKRRLGSDKPVVVRDPINKKEIRITLTVVIGNPFTKRRLGSDKPVVVKDQNNKREIIIH